MRDRASERERIKVRQARWKAIGACVRCGAPSGINPHTGKPFAHCFDHRVKVTTYNRQFVERRKKQEQAA